MKIPGEATRASHTRARASFGVAISTEPGDKMKVKTLQVLWHEKKPVLSVDFDPATGLLASCGTDKEIKLWRVGEDAEGNPDVTHEETLTAHTKTVNVVRFSPGGDALASGGDAGEVIVWRPGDKKSTNQHGDPTSWRTSAVLRGHSDDVQDLAWAPAGVGIVTGSVDNECIVWDVPKAKGALRLQGHAHYVQGVSWDPHGEYVVSQSGDRTVRIFASRGVGATHQTLSARWCKHLACQKVLKSIEEIPDPSTPVTPNAAADGATRPSGDAEAKLPRAPLFHDDTMGSFFRRPAWSPCGSFLVLPAGLYREHAGAKEQHTAYVYARDAFHRPVLRLPGVAPAACARFSPVFYAASRVGEEEAKPSAPSKDAEAVADAKPTDAKTTDTDVPLVETPGTRASSGAFDLPFRCVFAVCTTDTVTVYDTSSETPVAFAGGLHYAAITDAAWSPDGKTLVVSSSDGYCSVVQFTEAELGKPVEPHLLPAHLRKLTPEARVAAAAETAREPERRAAAAEAERAARAERAERAEGPESEAGATEPEVKRAAAEVRVGKPAHGGTAAHEARAPKRVAPTPTTEAAGVPAKLPRRVEPTAA